MCLYPETSAIASQQQEAAAATFQWTEEDENKLNRAVDQVELLNQQILELKLRLERATRNNQTAHAYSLQMRISTVTGVRNMFYQYCSQKAAKLMQYDALLQSQTTEDIESKLE